MFYYLFKKHGKIFLNGAYENDFKGYVKHFIKYPIRWQIAILRLAIKGEL